MTFSNPRPSGRRASQRGPNEEAVKTAQENVTQGYGHAGKARIMSGKPDGDTQGGPGANHEEGRAPVAPSSKTGREGPL